MLHMVMMKEGAQEVFSLVPLLPLLPKTTSTTFMCDINCNYYHYYQVPVQWSSLISLRLSALLFLPSFAGVFPFYLLPFYSVLNLAAVSVSQWLLCAMVEHT